MAKTTHSSLRHIVLTDLPDGEVLRAWDDLIQNCEDPTHFTSPDFFEDPYVGKGERLAVLVVDGDLAIGVVTGLRADGRIVCGLPVRPQTTFRKGADRSSTVVSFSKGLSEFGGKELELVDIYSWEPLEKGLPSGFVGSECTGGDRVVMLDLSKGADALFRDFSSRRRTQIRKVDRAGKLQIKHVENPSELAELYDIHCSWNKKKGFESDSFENFSKILGSQHRTVLIASFEGKIIAGTYLRFCENGMVEYAANNSLDEFQHLHANELLGWRAIEWACNRGFTKFSLGASHPFLNRFGGEIVAAYRYRADRTFLQRHTNRERIESAARNLYGSLPSWVKQRIRTFARPVLGTQA